MSVSWRPSASRERLAQRAATKSAMRDFFAVRGVLEVDTPSLVRRGVTDVNLATVTARLDDQELFLHTSPEYAMKRLLAAGSGDIYQLCHVFRAEERSALHNPEFTMLEWYRLGYSMDDLIEEVAALLDTAMQACGASPRPLRRLRYRDAFLQCFGVDPLEAPRERLAELALEAGLTGDAAVSLTRDGLLDFLVGLRLGPTLGQDCWIALTHYPASQAALAQLDPEDPALALRFEMYADGVELANGFQELANAEEQATRFAADNRERAMRGLPQRAADEHLLAALAEGLPACAGVALGVDRMLMIATGARSIDEVIPFTIEQA
ncbi:MAG: EF-P lysine aminoacylase GenX [Sinobacteraceae bacterium]|nr:EF-P lysine aminoacylase GenX [Nevskiaceae bacterium]